MCIACGERKGVMGKLGGHHFYSRLRAAMLEAQQYEVTVALPSDRLPWRRLLLYAVVLRQHPAELALPNRLSQGVTRPMKKLMEK